jgi:hypothetical protein
METIVITSVTDSGDGTNMTVSGTVNDKPFVANVPKVSLDALPSDAQRRLTVAWALQAANDRANPPSTNLGATISITPTSVSVKPSPTNH